jgi:hypothetical protein
MKIFDAELLFSNVCFLERHLKVSRYIHLVWRECKYVEKVARGGLLDADATNSRPDVRLPTLNFSTLGWCLCTTGHFKNWLTEARAVQRESQICRRWRMDLEVVSSSPAAGVEDQSQVGTVPKRAVVDAFYFLKLPPYHGISWRDSISRPIAPDSSVAGGDDTKNMFCDNSYC